jgi:hypothetical protein
LLPQAVQVGVVPIADTPLVCLLFYHLSLQIPITNLYVDYVDPLDLLSRSLAGATHSFAVLLFAL